MCSTSGFSASSMAARLEYRWRMLKRVANCSAINGSISHAATKCTPGIILIPSTCASAILPQPTIAAFKPKPFSLHVPLVRIAPRLDAFIFQRSVIRKRNKPAITDSVGAKHRLLSRRECPVALTVRVRKPAVGSDKQRLRGLSPHQFDMIRVQVVEPSASHPNRSHAIWNLRIAPASLPPGSPATLVQPQDRPAPPGVCRAASGS